jgi:hypothetical protein
MAGHEAQNAESDGESLSRFIAAFRQRRVERALANSMARQEGLRRPSADASQVYIRALASSMAHDEALRSTAPLALVDGDPSTTPAGSSSASGGPPSVASLLLHAARCITDGGPLVLESPMPEDDTLWAAWPYGLRNVPLAGPPGETAVQCRRRQVALTTASYLYMNQARSLQTREDIPSDCNLSAFKLWLSAQDTLQASVFIYQCPIIEHYSPRDSHGIPSVQHQVLLQDCSTAFRTRSLRSTPCAQYHCPQCVNWLGGYEFQYIGPWTCTSALDPTKNQGTPNGARQAWTDCRTCAGCRARLSNWMDPNEL